MANALGTLFGDIAGAIREKTGDTATMKPAQFPEKIAAIEAGGSGGGSATGLRSKQISMTLTGAYGSRVSIDFGFKPLMIVIYPDNKLSIANSVYFTCIGSVRELGFSERISYVYSNKITTQLQGGYIDGDDINKPIYNADETGFNLGKSLGSGAYIIYAIG